MTVTILTGSVEVEPIPQMGTFGTTVQELNRCLEWLLGNHCSTVVVESTGTYWVPVWNIVHERVAVIVANPEHVKARRGEKTDPEDSRRLAERLRVGDVRGSFVPSAQIVELRDLTRRRKRLLSAANSERNRIQKLLEQANVKIGNVVTDVFGVSGQRILHALLQHPQLPPAALADLAKGRLRHKRQALIETLQGHRLNDHVRWMIQHSLDHLVFLENQLTELSPKDFAETPALRARVRAVADDPRHRRRNRCRDSGRNRRQHGAGSQPQAPDQLGGRLSRQQSVGGQAKERFHQARQQVVACSPGAVRLGHCTAARLHLQKAVLSTDATPRKKASADCRGPIPARGGLAGSATHDSLQRTGQRSLAGTGARQEDTTSPSALTPARYRYQRSPTSAT
jgi:hypothetical protein